MSKTWRNNDPRELASVKTTLEDGSTASETDYCYNSFYQVIEKDEFDYGTGGGGTTCNGTTAPGLLLRKTVTDYASFGQLSGQYPSQTYTGQWINDRPLSVITYDGSGNRAAETDYTYGNATTGVTATSHDDSNYGSNSAFNRGNLLSFTKQCFPNCANTTTSFTYDDTGQVLSQTDPNLNTTNYSYADNFATGTPPGATDGYLTQITYPPTNGISHIDKYSYNYADGTLASSTDENNQPTYYAYSDSLDRLTSVSYPDTGDTQYSYNDIAPMTTTATKKVTGSLDLVQTTTYDGLDREIRRDTTNGEQTPYDEIDTCYDGLGRISFKSYPYQTSSFSGTRCSNSATPGDTFAYDALDRTTSVTHSDSSSVMTSYYDRATSVQDEGNGTSRVERVSQTDGLGRLSSVCEVSSSILSAGISGSTTPAACGQDIGATGFLTSYSYNALDNLLSVTQEPLNARTFTYNSLSQLITAENPESGTDTVSGSPIPTTYTYDADGNVLTKTDARNVTITYAYDNLNRLTGKTYSDSTPAVTYTYDQCSVSGVSFFNTVGRICSESTAGTNPTESVFSYDPLGRVLNNSQCTPQNCGSSLFPITYSYDFAGETNSSTNGAGVTFTSTPNNNGNYTGERILTLASSLSDSDHPGTLLSDAQYNASGELLSATLGNGATDSWAYTPRSLPQSMTTDGMVNTQGAPGSGSVSLSGTLQSKQVQTQPATAGTGSVTISGSEQAQTTYTEECYYYPPPTGTVCYPVGSTTYDYGTASVTVNGVLMSTSWGNSGSSWSGTSATIASSLASVINGTGNSPVTASVSGSTISLQAKAVGVSTNYSLSTAVASQFGSFSSTPSGSTLTGGANAVYTTVYDSGTSVITVDGHSDSVNWSGSGTTTSSIASALASAINGDSGAPISASASSGTVYLTAKTIGVSTNYLLSSSSTYDSNDFSGPSFTNSDSGANLTGGQDAGLNPGVIYSYGLTYAPDGDVLTGNDSVNGNWTYGYDDFNRLISSSQNNGAVAYTYGYDRFGNRWNQTVTAGSGSSSSLSFDANNRIVPGNGVAYDAAGNVTNDGSHTYSYDAEERISQVDGGSTATYIYDAEGRRVRKTTSSGSVDYLYDLAGHEVAEMSSSGAWNRGEVYAAGLHLATYANGTTVFSHADWLGTERVRSAVNASACETITSLPFGDDMSFSGACSDSSPMHFTGKQRDSETASVPGGSNGLDYFGARYDSSSVGRFMSPDWSAQVEPVAYASFTDPQTLNLYSYGRNNPEGVIDISGHCPMTWFTLVCHTAQRFNNLFHGQGFHTNAQVGEFDKATSYFREIGVSTKGLGFAAVIKTYQTYTKTNLKTGEVYTGRTSGTGTPAENVAQRDSAGYPNSDYGPAKLDRSSTNPNAIRGREQQLIDQNGGAKSQGGTSGNQINGVSQKNPKADQYRQAARDEFGEPSDPEAPDPELFDPDIFLPF